jgi:hypothetical protein
MKIRTSKIYQALLARLLEEQNHLEMWWDVNLPTQLRNKIPLSALKCLRLLFWSQRNYSLWIFSSIRVNQTLCFEVLEHLHHIFIETDITLVWQVDSRALQCTFPCRAFSNETSGQKTNTSKGTYTILTRFCPMWHFHSLEIKLSLKGSHFGSLWSYSEKWDRGTERTFQNDY